MMDTKRIFGQLMARISLVIRYGLAALALLACDMTAGARSFYIHVDGDDAADGSRLHPWKSSKVLESVRLLPGDTVWLQAGAVFERGIRWKQGNNGRAGRPIVLTTAVDAFSAGAKGLATILAGNEAALVLHHVAYVELRNIRMAGAGRKEGNQSSGLIIDSCRSVSIDSLDVAGFQRSGVWVHASKDIVLSRVGAHDNGFAGISVEGNYGTHDCRNIRITRCRADNNPGDPTNLTNHSGNGIITGYCRQVLIEYCSATGNGWDMPRVGNGPVGIWGYECDSLRISHCVSYRNRTSHGGDDGGGFDLDGGMTHAVIEYCLSYENEGSGYGIFQYAGAGNWRDNSVHDCVSFNDGRVSAARAGVFIWNSSHDSLQFAGCRFYRNKIYNDRGAALHYASESDHRRFVFEDNVFSAGDSLVKGVQGPGDVFVRNRWDPLGPNGTSVNGNSGDGTSGDWKDTDGHFINAHGAGVLYQDGFYYLFGEIKKGRTRLVPGQDWEDYRVPAGGVSCYSSRDLVHWKNEGVVLSPAAGGDLDTSRVIERPKVIYNTRTRQYVMWMHIDKEDYSYARAGVAVSDRPQGPYRYLGSVRPNGQMSRDMTVFKDDDDRAYLIYTSEDNNTMQVCLLSPDYLSPTPEYTRILEGQRREAPAVFKHAGRYYLITSLCTGWDPNAAMVAVADSMLGTWQPQGNPCVGPGARLSFLAQSSFVLPLQTAADFVRTGADSKTAIDVGRPAVSGPAAAFGDAPFLFLADRWNKTDLEHSQYCWLPLVFEGGRPVIRDVAGLYRTVWRPGDRVQHFELRIDSASPAAVAVPAAQHSLSQMLRPFWAGDTVFSETVLLWSDSAHPGRLASGQLLYQPERIVSVRSYDGGQEWRQGIDFNVSGRRLNLLRGSSMPFRWDSSFDRRNLAWYDLQGQWVTVSYTHKDRWAGALPAPQTALLPGLVARLKHGAPLRIAAYGMSITRGMDVSSYHRLSPYTPNYIDLFTEELARRHPRSILSCYNAGLPGAAVDWGAQNAYAYIAPLRADLVLIDFGMNDFWRIPPAEFADSIRSVIRTVRRGNPAVEFLLIANMQFDPAYIADSDRNKPFYTGNMQGYRDTLLSMQGPGIACLDMTSLSAAIFRRKKAKDCIVNPLHPNDYLGRWYAQGLLRVCEDIR